MYGWGLRASNGRTCEAVTVRLSCMARSKEPFELASVQVDPILESMCLFQRAQRSLTGRLRKWALDMGFGLNECCHIIFQLRSISQLCSHNVPNGIVEQKVRLSRRTRSIPCFATSVNPRKSRQLLRVSGGRGESFTKQFHCRLWPILLQLEAEE